jgi:threonine synthase
MGVMLMLEVWREARGTADDARLAIASCGNAALAAAVIARAAGRALDVFVPTWASGAVVDRLHALGAAVKACERTPGVPGDPCYHRFKRAVAHGAIPFCCQGSDNGLTIEGGETIAWEILDACDGLAPDAVFVQVGGGALATAILRGFSDDHRFGHTPGVARLHAVQTLGCAPLVRAYDRVVEHLLRSTGATADALDTLSPASAATRAERARTVAVAVGPHAIDAALQHAAVHRSRFMWPWEAEPRSIATGILDDETYDWLAIVEGMLRTGGHPVLASEETLAAANRIVRDATDIDACVTGTSGLAGLMDALGPDARLRRERVAVIISGHRR